MEDDPPKLIVDSIADETNIKEIVVKKNQIFQLENITQGNNLVRFFFFFLDISFITEQRIRSNILMVEELKCKKRIALDS